MREAPDIKLIRTDTTLDLSQKPETAISHPGPGLPGPMALSLLLPWTHRMMQARATVSRRCCARAVEGMIWHRTRKAVGAASPAPETELRDHQSAAAGEEAT